MSNAAVNDDTLLVRYLLGAPLPEAELARLEQTYFADDRLFDHLMGLEDDLIDEYLCGALSKEDRLLFETHFAASPRRREKIQAQRAILEFFRGSSRRARLLIFLRRLLTGANAWWPLAAAASAACLALAALTGLAVNNFRLRGDAEQLRARIHDLERMPPARVTSILLSPGVLKSSGGALLRIEPTTYTVLLQLSLDRGRGQYVAFEAALRTADGDEVAVQRRLTGKRRAHEEFVEVQFPASCFANGDYILTLSGIGSTGEREALPSYVFRALQ